MNAFPFVSLRFVFFRLAPTPPRWTSLLGAGLAVLSVFLAAGCASSGGSADYTVDQAALATYALASAQQMEHGPDSLAHLQVVEKKGKLNFQLRQSYREMTLEWTAGREWLSPKSAPSGLSSLRGSARLQRTGAGPGDARRTGAAERQRGSRHAYFRTYATLWSKELSLASMISGRGIHLLSKDLARKMVRKRMARYDRQLKIDVYVFAPSARRLDLSRLQLDGAGKRIRLRDGQGNAYKPVQIKTSIPLEAYNAGRETVYIRNTLFFRRSPEKDPLGAEQLHLYVRPTGYRFTWVLPQR